MTARAPAAAGLRQYGGLPVLTWPVFDPLPVDVLVTTRHGGVSAGRYATLNLSFAVGDDPALVRVNRSRAAAALGADLADLVFADRSTAPRPDRDRRGSRPGRAGGHRPTSRHQPTSRHWPAGHHQHPAAAGPVGPADALVTTEPGPVLTILVADCVPVVLYDPTAHVLACVHGGWRGTVARVPPAAVAAMASLGASAGAGDRRDRPGHRG